MELTSERERGIENKKKNLREVRSSRRSDSSSCCRRIATVEAEAEENLARTKARTIKRKATEKGILNELEPTYNNNNKNKYKTNNTKTNTNNNGPIWQLPPLNAKKKKIKKPRN